MKKPKYKIGEMVEVGFMNGAEKGFVKSGKNPVTNSNPNKRK